MLIGMTSTTSTPEQLTLLPEVEAPLRFRLDDATRRRGLRHVAEIRAQLERQRTGPAPTTIACPAPTVASIGRRHEVDARPRRRAQPAEGDRARTASQCSTVGSSGSRARLLVVTPRSKYSWMRARQVAAEPWTTSSSTT